MTIEVPGFKLGTLTAAADLSGKQYRTVKLTSSGTVNVTNLAADIPIGVLQNKPTSGQPCEIMCSGVTKALVGANITAGGSVMSDVNGSFIPATGAGNFASGVALETGITGDIIAVLLQPQRVLP